MKTLSAAALALILCLACSVVQAYTFTPPDYDLGDMAHGSYYVWGIAVPWDIDPDPFYESVSGATLSIHSIFNWNTGPNDLWIHLLDDAPIGLTVGSDGEDGVDQFDGEGVLLVHYEDLGTTPQDVFHVFTNEQRTWLNEYASDGVFALAFDPDCHFHNCGVQLDVDTERIEILEPATLSLVGAAISVLGIIRLRGKR